jgi:sulfoxide reductase heme-binding subunit YedZ
MTTALWYVGRGSGVVSLLLLTVVMVLGVGSRSGRPAFGLPRFGVVALHRTASLLSVVFLAIHVVTLTLDPQAELRLVDLVLPFDAATRPLWTGLGTVGLDLTVAIVVTSLLRHRIGRRAWRAVHWLAYLSWPVAVAHTLGTGTDRSTWWLLALTLVCAVAVAAALVWRAGAEFGRPRASLPAVPPVPPVRQREAVR